MRAQGKKLREIGETLNEARKISRQRVWQLERNNPESKKYAKVTVKIQTREWLKSLADDFDYTVVDIVDFLIYRYLGIELPGDGDDECTCKPNDDMLCPACRKFLEEKEIL